MVRGRSVVQETEGSEEDTTTKPNVALPLRLGLEITRLHYLFLVPLILLITPSRAILGMNLPVIGVLTISGLAGNFAGKRPISLLTSISLLFILVWGKVAQDLLRTGPPDTAAFLIEFGMTIFLMEANLVVLTFYKTNDDLKRKDDELSMILHQGLINWVRNQLSLQGMIAIGSLGLSLVLLPIAGLTSISTTELPLTGGLLLVAIIALLFLVTYRREPERR